MFTKFTPLLLCLLAGSAIGCASDSAGPADPPAEDASAGQAMHEIATIELSRGDVAFHSVGDAEGVESEGAPRILIQESFELGAGSPIEVLFEENGPLTSLEIFLALSDDAAPAALEQAHAEEASGLGRASDDVLEVEFDAAAPLPKSSATCDSWAFPVDDGFWQYPNKLRRDQMGTTPWVPVGTGLNDWNFWTFRSVTMAVCNESSGTVHSQVAWDTGSGWNTSSQYALGAHRSHRWWDVNFGGSAFTRYSVRAIASSSRLVRVRSSNMQRVVR